MIVISRINDSSKLDTKILQFGEGIFLRGFVDYMIDVANEKGVFNGGVTIVKPVTYGNLDRFKNQDSVYTVILRGKAQGQTGVEKRVITAVNNAVDPYSDYDSYIELSGLEGLRFIVSNTTEAGITYDSSDSIDLRPANSYPGKLTQFLYERYKRFSGAEDKGLIILPVELIEKNGKKLKECVLKLTREWELPDDFYRWVEECNIFCDTLVDRIITGYPSGEEKSLLEELGYQDDLIVTGEPFALWVIESDRADLVREALPLDRAGLPVIFTDNQQPYRERKVRILNGAHTSTVLAAYLAGFNYVGECMEDKVIRAFMEKTVYDEIVPTVHLPQDEVKVFADSVFERFENPYIKHELLSISLNSVSKWKSRILPTIKDFWQNTGKLPECLSFSLAALAAFYCANERGDRCLIGYRNEDSYNIRDDVSVLDFFAEMSGKDVGGVIKAFLSRTDFWDEDLTELDGFAEKVTDYFSAIRAGGVTAAMEDVIAK